MPSRGTLIYRPEEERKRGIPDNGLLKYMTTDMSSPTEVSTPSINPEDTFVSRSRSGQPSTNNLLKYMTTDMTEKPYRGSGVMQRGERPTTVRPEDTLVTSPDLVDREPETNSLLKYMTSDMSGTDPSPVTRQIEEAPKERPRRPLERSTSESLTRQLENKPAETARQSLAPDNPVTKAAADLSTKESERGSNIPESSDGILPQRNYDQMREEGSTATSSDMSQPIGGGEGEGTKNKKGEFWDDLLIAGVPSLVSLLVGGSDGYELGGQALIDKYSRREDLENQIALDKAKLDHRQSTQSASPKPPSYSRFTYVDDQGMRRTGRFDKSQEDPNLAYIMTPQDPIAPGNFNPQEEMQKQQVQNMGALQRATMLGTNIDVDDMGNRINKATGQIEGNIYQNNKGGLLPKAARQAVDRGFKRADQVLDTKGAALDDLKQLSIQFERGDELGKKLAINALIKRVETRLTDQDREFYFYAHGKPKAMLDEWKRLTDIDDPMSDHIQRDTRRILSDMIASEENGLRDRFNQIWRSAEHNGVNYEDMKERIPFPKNRKVIVAEAGVPRDQAKLFKIDAKEVNAMMDDNKGSYEVLGWED